MIEIKKVETTMLRMHVIVDMMKYLLSFRKE